jgi:PAS domain S-box-containing protein
MKDQSKTNQVMIQELASLRQRIEELEQSESEWMEEKEGLKKSEARFRSYFNLPIHGIAIISPEKGWIEVNDRICSMIGYSRDEITRMTWSEMTHPDDLAENLKQFNRVLSGQIDHYNMDKRFIRKDGKVVWTNLSVGSVRKPDGSVDHMIAVVEDITERKRIETALRTSEERFSKVFQASPAATYISTISDGRYIDVNNSGLQQLGYTREEMIGHTVRELGIWHNYSGRKLILQKLIALGSIRNEPVLFRMKKGEVKETLLSCEIIRLNNKEVMLSLVYDITELRRAEDALRKSEELFTKLVNTIPDIIVHTDLEGNIIFANENSLLIFGYKREEIEGQNVLKFVVPRDQEVAKKNLKLQLNGRLTPTEFNLLTKDGKEITFEINGDVLRKEDGTPFGIVHVCRDITERKRTERVLRENDERLRGITQNLPGIIFQFYAKDDGEYGLSYISEPLDEFSKIIVGEDAANLDTFFSSFVSRVYEEDRDRFLVSIKTAVETVTPWNFEGRIALQSGMMVWFQGLSIPTRYEDQLVFDGILLNITERKLAEDELKLFAENLEDANIALRVLMNRRDKDQKEFEEKLQVNINDLVIPSLKKLKMGNLDDRNKNYVSVLEKNLSDILSPFMRDIRSSHKNLTPQEIQIVDLIRQGKNTKEIADMLNASVNTIATHRDNIRKKMNLINSKINLRSHILSLK